MVKNRDSDKKGIIDFLFFIPIAERVRLVIKRFTVEMVVLTPDSITPITARSCEPKPVNLIFEENGVIKVQPTVVYPELEH